MSLYSIPFHRIVESYKFETFWIESTLEILSREKEEEELVQLLSLLAVCMWNPAQ